METLKTQRDVVLCSFKASKKTVHAKTHLHSLNHMKIRVQSAVRTRRRGLVAGARESGLRIERGIKKKENEKKLKKRCSTDVSTRE
jgi:hypothetical protein